MKQDNILVTGGGGFIGHHLVEKLINQGYPVFVIDDLSGGKAKNVPRQAHFFKSDLRDTKKAAQIISQIKPRIVYHLAANAAENKAQFSPIDITSRTYNTFVNTLVPALNHGMKRFIFASSIAVYGSLQTPFKETDAPEPEDLYGIAKLAVERSLQVLAQVHGFEYVIVRPHNCYGPYQNTADPYRNVVAIFMNSLLKAEPLYIYDDGRQRRCFSYIEDVAQAIYKCGWLDVSGMTFNLGSDRDYSVNQLAGLIQQVANIRVKPIYIPARPQEVKQAIANHTLAKKYLKYQDKTPLLKGLKKTWHYVQSIGIQEPVYTEIEIDSPKLPQNWRKKA